jgi:hypothetical protein
VALLIDTRIVGEVFRLREERARPAPAEIGLRRLEIASQDGEAIWCRMTAAAGSPAWPPEVAPGSRWADGAAPGEADGTALWELVLGLGDDQLPVLDGRDVADMARDLLGGDLPDLALVSNWYLLITRSPNGEVDGTGWAAQSTLGTDPPPPPVSPLVARAIGPLFDEGWEPRRAADEPSVVIATVEPEDGWTLSVTVDDDTGEVVVAVTLPDQPDVAPGTTGPGRGDLAALAVDGNGAAGVYARVTTVDGTLPVDTLAGMIDAVIDAAHEWTPAGE